MRHFCATFSLPEFLRQIFFEFIFPIKIFIIHFFHQTKMFFISKKSNFFPPKLLQNRRDHPALLNFTLRFVSAFSLLNRAEIWEKPTWPATPKRKQALEWTRALSSTSPSDFGGIFVRFGRVSKELGSRCGGLEEIGRTILIDYNGV